VLFNRHADTVPKELDGSHSIKNLWPESYRISPWNARVKDRLENRLHELLCDGELDLKTAQCEIAANWIEAYKKYVTLVRIHPFRSRLRLVCRRLKKRPAKSG
jgi:hypothetical protein